MHSYNGYVFKSSLLAPDIYRIQITSLELYVNIQCLEILNFLYDYFFSSINKSTLENLGFVIFSKGVKIK